MNSSVVQQTSARLFSSTQNIRQRFYGSDVKIVYQLTRSILRHESAQHGFNLTATQDVLFNEVHTPDTNTHARTHAQV